MEQKNAPKLVIRRLPVYLRILDNLISNDVEIVSSRELSDETGFTAEQIRKDLAFFGAFGTRGTGYNTSFLREKILKIIGLDEHTNIVIVGAGHLGIALTRYNITKNPYVNVVAVFDVDPHIIGEKIIDVEVMHISRLKEIAKRHAVKVALLTVPSEQAPIAASEIANSGISVILNFSLSKLHVPDSVYVRNADLSIELQSLIYYANSK
ncbi:MAG TPA: redox-sensing transcriptional repressor Rex [Firmicutes bacterium]|jgi:redox-sensing transcriptional repressor|nr:redox-sensing transcriptional repressor Rex [Bacillota bacterium]